MHARSPTSPLSRATSHRPRTYAHRHPAPTRDAPYAERCGANSLFDLGGFGQHLPETFSKRFPPVNVAETEASYQITIELPGMEEKDIELQLMGNNLVISGERRWEEEEKTKEMHRMESELGSFRRDVPLPQGLRINAEDVDAVDKKGVLKVVVPKVEPTPASRIAIEAE